MKSIKPHSSRALFQLLALMSGFQHIHALTQEYCSSENTGSDYSAEYSIYQSNGLCKTTCNDDYAFAVVQYQNCWCSNYAPADTVNVSECDTKCPGYPDESCGNSDSGYYGYIALDKSPSGTAGGSSSAASSTAASSSASSTSQPSSTQESTSSFSSTSSTSSTSSSSAPPPSTTSTTSSQRRQNTVYSSISVTVYSTVEQSTSIVVSYVTLSSTSEPSTTSSPSSSTTPTSTSSSTTPSSTTSSSETPTAAAITTTSDSAAASSTSGTEWTHTTLVSTRVVTIAGAPVTQTVTSTPMVVNPNAETQEPERKGVSSGTIAGAVVGSVLGLALLLAGAFFLWRRRRSGSDAGSTTSSSARRKMERNTSVLSRTGLLASAGAATDPEKDIYHGPGFINTAAANNTRRHSTLYAAESGGPSPISPAGDNGSQPTRRDSRPLVFDQRLNPAAIMSSWEANGSRTSIGTMHDQRDYSRPLGVTNPDPIDD